ncbi:MAG: tail fiber domain-containing protein, partial [Cyanobacteria bacterium J06636_27]
EINANNSSGSVLINGGSGTGDIRLTSNDVLELTAATEVDLQNLSISGSTIGSISNTDVTIQPNGTGAVNVNSGAEIDMTAAANSNINLTTSGTGSVVVSSLTVTDLAGAADTYIGDGVSNSFTISAGGVFSSSDRRLKENIELLRNTLSKLDKLGGYNYNYKADTDKRKQIGVIAQELEKVFPELIGYDDNGYKMVNYQGLIPVLIEAIKEQQLEITLLNKKVADQESKLSELASDNEEMKSDLDLIKKMLLGDKTVKEED